MKIQLSAVNKPQAMFSFSSLTDIVLLLLIFFLLTSSFIVSSGIKVNVPDATHSEAVQTERITVTLLKDGSMFINDRAVTTAVFTEEFKKVFHHPEMQTVIVNSDKEVPLDRAVFVIDAAKSAGASRFFISTQQRSSQR